jgi:hypothetical protein
MQTLRNARYLGRFVVVWFALSIGVAVASPLVQPKDIQWVCSGAGLMKVIASGDDGAQKVTGHTLDCPLCAGVGAPPPVAAGHCDGVPGLAFAAGKASSPDLVLTTAAPLPARGPPAFL